VLEAGRVRLGNCPLGTARTVSSVQHLEDAGHGGLHAQRQSGEAGLAQLGEISGRHRFGIRLGGDLSVRLDTESFGDLGDDQAEMFGGQQRGRAATEEDRRHRRHRRIVRARAEHVGREPDLVEHRVGVRPSADPRS
jgi:hypothetical protein